MTTLVHTTYLLLYGISIITTKCHQISTQAIQDYTLQGEPEPKFQEPIVNVTSPAGREAVLTCSVKNLGKYKVGWLRASDQTVLALQGRVVTHNVRISVTNEDLHTWRLKIRQLRETDRGCYMCQINTSPMKKQIGCIDVQVPPDIVNEDSSTDVSVLEGEDATLTCRATGNPTPRVVWRREDGDTIILRRSGSREVIRADTHNGTFLRMIKLERRQMGAYLCIASNDVPPAVSKRVSLSVLFAPSVRAPSQLLGAPLGSDVQLNCQIESSPTPVSYWLKGGRLPTNGFTGNAGGLTVGGGIEAGQARPEMLLDGPKYEISEQRSGYKGLMKLTIRKFSISDVGTYHCVSTNSLGRAEGTVRVYEIKINPGSSIENDITIIGGLAEATKGRGHLNSANRFLINDSIILTTIIDLFIQYFIGHFMYS